MRIALSSAAAPSASLSELLDGCTRRGLFALHLVAGHAHGVTSQSSDDELQAAAARARAQGVEIVSVELTDAGAQDTQRLARQLGAVVIGDGAVLDAAATNVADAAVALFTREPGLQHITLRGGGPEAAQFEGRGIGALMAQLALRNYQGVLALAPSSNAVLPVWRTWLQRGRNWGCGSKAADPSLVQLG
jgi:hypothetical protein